jgi:hypothetical protein
MDQKTLTISVTFKMPSQMKIGTIFRSGDIIYVVTKVEYDDGTKPNRERGWRHSVRNATKSEQLLFDVMQT